MTFWKNARIFLSKNGFGYLNLGRREYFPIPGAYYQILVVDRRGCAIIAFSFLWTRLDAPAEGESFSVQKQAGAKLNMPAWASFPWRLQRHLLTNIKSDDESDDKKKICWRQNSAEWIRWQTQNLLTRSCFLQNCLRWKNYWKISEGTNDKCDKKRVITAYCWRPWR